ncbi:substrate-binding domain-containing protein [Paenibacillus silvisoli]|uniref:substrate-binding domain-containing protein n=1 Tax=Paenibacillus silvisoli TaxID=3110539 RepID=UPI0028039ED8|nr:substrate-binding domain-containing protein [Paenibacillus silvisoli]
MKKLVLLSVIVGSLAALAITIFYILTIYQNDLGMTGPETPAVQLHAKRIVLISQEQGSYVMNEIQKGARDAAASQGLSIDFWGVYRSNYEELLKQLDIAIASKIDGIIIEGVDRPEFANMVNKATFKGIPVITINSDAPGSLRKTYVGSDHYEEGVAMGKHIASSLHGQGTIGIITNTGSSDTDQLRQKGLREVLGGYAGIKLVYASNAAAKTQATVQTFDILNHNPSVKAFIGLQTDSAKEILQAGHSRSRAADYQVFMFDNAPQTVQLLDSKQIRAGLSQHYEDMGKMSVDLMKQWLDSKDLPLAPRYFTPVSVVVPGPGFKAEASE